MRKKGPFFGPQNVRKSRRAKMGLPSRSGIRASLVLLMHCCFGGVLASLTSRMPSWPLRESEF